MDDVEVAREILREVGQQESSELVETIAAVLAGQRGAILRAFADLASHMDRKAAEVEGRPRVDAAQLMRLHASTLRVAIEELGSSM